MFFGNLNIIASSNKIPLPTKTFTVENLCCVRVCVEIIRVLGGETDTSCSYGVCSFVNGSAHCSGCVP